MTSSPISPASNSDHDTEVARQGIRRNRVGRAICKLMAERSEWQGTASQLLEHLTALCPNDRRLASQTPGGLGQHLSRVRDLLVKAGCVRIETDRVGHDRTRMIYLTTLDLKVCGDVGMNTPKKVTGAADEADDVHQNSDDAKRALSLAIASIVR